MSSQIQKYILEYILEHQKHAAEKHQDIKDMNQPSRVNKTV